MTEDQRRAEALLTSLVANGLVLDVEREHAVSFLMNYGEVGTMGYVSHYAVSEADGTLRLGFGSTFTRLEGDMLFDEELRWHLLNALTFIRMTLQNQAHYYLKQYLEENPELTVHLSDFDVDYTDWKSVSLLGLGELFHDYDYLFPRSVQESIAGEYHLTPEGFCSWLEAFVYVYETAEKSRRLVDLKLPFSMARPTPESSLAVDWNYFRSMVGNVILAYDWMASQVEAHGADWLEEEVRASLLRYDINPQRIGLSDGKEIGQITLSDVIFRGRFV